MLRRFKSLWQRMSEEDRKGLSFVVVYHTEEITNTLYGMERESDLLAVAACSIDSYAKQAGGNYEEYREEVIAALKGLGAGLLDGGLDYYLHNPPKKNG